MYLLKQILLLVARTVIRRRSIQDLFSRAGWVLASSQALDPVLVRALVAGEDHRFSKHCGVDPQAILSAVWRFLRASKISGASTINQQLVRVLTGRYERTIRRKAREILLAVLIDDFLSKEDIATAYLHVAYFGWGMNGIHEACERLGLSPEHLSGEASAGLIARLKYPEPRQPSPMRLRQIAARRDFLLAKMGADTYEEHFGMETKSHVAVLNV